MAARYTVDSRDKSAAMERTRAESLVLAKLKMAYWNRNGIPDGIPLIPGKDVVVGRCGEANVVLRSTKLPAMLSRRHAVLRYSSTDKHWLVEDLKSVNGVYVNHIRIQSGIPKPLKIGDKICFGVDVDINEFKYLLVIEHGMPVLKRLAGAGVRKLESDSTMIVIHLAKLNVEMNREDKLLSSIEALQSELAAKEQLVAKKEEKEKVSVKPSTANDSMLSSMKEEFTCVICQEMFINAYTLPCAHSFCELCIKVWMNGKRQKDCPICRKKITSDPVRSLVLDNAIAKLIVKLGSDAKEEREMMEKSHAEDLKALNAATGGSSVFSWSISDPDETEESFDSEESSEEPFLD